MPRDYLTVPQTGTAWASVTPRNIFVSGSAANNRYTVNTTIIDGTLSRDVLNTGNLNILRAGLILGKVTSGGKYASSVLGVKAVLHDTSVVTTTMTLPAYVVTEISRRIGASGSFKIVGPPTTAGTVAIETVAYSAIASATTLTITATSADFAAGSLIMPADGSETPETILDNPYGVDVTDRSGTSVDAMLPRYLIGADLVATQILGLTTDGTTAVDASVQTWLKGKLRANGQTFTFDNDR